MMNRKPGYLPEDEEAQRIEETVSVPPGPNLEIDPAILAAREARDRRVAQSMLFEGISDIGAGLAGVKSDAGFYENQRKAAGQGVTDATSDAERRSKTVAEYMRDQREKAKLNQDESRYQRDDEYKRGRDSQSDSLARDRLAFDREKLKEDIALRRQMAQMSASEKKAAMEQKAIEKEEQRNKPSDANNLAAGYGRRMEQAEANFDSLSKKGFNRADKWSALQDAASNLPFVGDVARATVQGEDSKLQEQAELNFLSAVLRRESGASISPSERDKGALQYFPRVGDSEEVLKQKKENRQQAMESLKASAGPAWNKVASVGGQKTGSGLDPAARRKRIAELKAKQNAAQ